MRKFDTGATRDSDDYKLDYEGAINPLVLEAYGEYMHYHRKLSDGTLRDSDNWQKGFGKDVLAKSLIRHNIEFWKDHRGYQVHDRKTGKVVYIKDTLCAILFNAQAYLLEIIKEENAIGDIRPQPKVSFDEVQQSFMPELPDEVED